MAASLLELLCAAIQNSDLTEDQLFELANEHLDDTDLDIAA